MASITERSGSFRATVRLPGGRRETGTFDSRAEAEAWAAGLEQKKAVGALKTLQGSGVTVEQLWDAYELAVSSKRDSARWDAIRFRAWAADPLAKMRLTEVRTHDINEWIDRRCASVSGSTVNRELNLLSGAFTYAVKDRRWLTENPCHGCRRPERGRPRDHRLLSPDQIKAIRVATGYEDDPELKTKTAKVGACFLLALETGMRSGEILRLRPQDYYRDERYVHVAAIEKGGRKGSRSGRSSLPSSRDVPLTERAIELLDQLLAARDPESPYIVGLRDDQRDALWRKARDRSGVDELHFHDTKHEAATRLSRFLDVFQLSHAIGTKDLRLLRDTYYSRDVKRSAALLPRSLAA